MLDKDKYQVRFVTEPAWENEKKAGLRVVAYEIVDVQKSIDHAYDQIIYTTKDLNEADRYCAMLNKQDQLERS
jgi:hypothetical protein